MTRSEFRAKYRAFRAASALLRRFPALGELPRTPSFIDPHWDGRCCTFTRLHGDVLSYSIRSYPLARSYELRQPVRLPA